MDTRSKSTRRNIENVDYASLHSGKSAASKQGKIQLDQSHLEAQIEQLQSRLQEMQESVKKSVREATTPTTNMTTRESEEILTCQKMREKSIPFHPINQ